MTLASFRISRFIAAFYYQFNHPFMRVIETSLEEDLSLFSAYLWQQRVPHRIFEESGRQVLEVRESGAADAVRASYSAWQRGELVLKRRAAAEPQAGEGRRRIGAVLAAYPVLIVVLAVAVCVFPFTSTGGITKVLAALTFVDLSGPGGLPHGEPWRWLTPIFIHFSVVHLLFNVAVTTDFGRRIESGRGSLRFAGLIVGIGVASNFGQYLVGGSPMFGGLSGVAYGLLGYVLVSQRRFPGEPDWHVHQGLAFSLLLFLVIFSTGITEVFDFYVANTAHWVGLVTGGLLAAVRPGGRSLFPEQDRSG
jgi:GlpG protein